MSGIGTGISAPFLEHMSLGEVVIIIPPEPPIIEINTLTLTLPVPDDTQDGDMLFALISTDANPAMTLPFGWNAEDDIGGTAKSFIDFRLSPGGEPVDYTWTLDGLQDAIGAIIRFINVDPDDPINVKVKNSGNGAVLNVPSITTTVVNTMLLTLISLNDGVLIDPDSLRANRQNGLWLVNSSGTAIGSVGSSASYKTLKKAKTYPAYTLNTLGAIVTDYYIIQVALAPDVEILYTLTDSNNDKLRDSDNIQLVTE
jgi:hypothetical protein